MLFQILKIAGILIADFLFRVFIISTGVEIGLRAYKKIFMVKQYRKKPVVIQAIQYDGFNTGAINDFCGNKVREPVGEHYLEIETLEGVMRANAGDFIIRGVNGEFYPCKPDIFEKTYEEVKR